MVGTKAICRVKEIFEFKAGIADNAGVWCLPTHVAVRKRFADLFLQLLLYVLYDKLNAHLLCGVDGVFTLCRLSVIQIEADEFASTLHKKPCAHGGVYPAGKAKHYLAHFLPSM